MVQPVDSPQRCAMSVSNRLVDGALIAEVGGVVDMVTAPTLTDHLLTAVETAPAALVIDLTHVDFLTAAGLGVLVGTHDAAADTTAVVVVADGPVTHRPIVLTGVDREVPVYATVTVALAALHADG